MNYYDLYFKLAKEHPDISPINLFTGICQALTKTATSTKEDFMDVTRAFNRYKEEVNNERITSTISAS